jgi:uncharacterized protein YecT (DUF1311 family)
MRLISLVNLSIITITSLNFLSGVSQTAYAQQTNCSDSSNLNQSQINECAYRFYQNEDKKLNQAYKKLLPKLSASRKQKLINAQQAWIKFRDTSCDFERSEVEGGSMSPTVYYGCMESLTKQRTKELNDYLRVN